MKDKISLAGDLGSGKSTVSAILVDRIGAEYYSTGSIVRSIAESRGMSVVELNVYMESHPEIDREIDSGLAALADVDKLLIIDSRLAWYFTPDTFKVYLSTDIETSALRIMTANRKGEHAMTLEDTVKQTRERRDSEKKRYMEQYGLDIKDLSNYSLVVDTTNATPEEVAESIVLGFEAWRSDRSYKRILITPERLKYPACGSDPEQVSELSDALARGEQIPEVTVFEKDGSFYLESGVNSALAYAFNMSTFIPARLVISDIADREYIEMKSSL